ncbi:MAG TPA: hypothetical protein PKY59_09955 [Pyrinomonadaceae bacterium]|nr:hypothetical protein [Pyrinomonadaceae bacterium]
MFFNSNSYADKAKSMRIWAVGIGLRSLFWGLLAGRNIIPDFFSIVVANTGLILAEIVLLKAIGMLHDKKINQIWFFAIGGISTIVLSYFTYLSPSLMWRVEYISFISICVGLVGTFILFSSKTEKITFAQLVCGILYIFCVIATITRATDFALHKQQTANLFSGDSIESLSFAVIFVCLVMITFVFMLMINSKFNSELLSALAEVKTLKSLLPMCSYCKNIRDDEDDWHKVEDYLLMHTDTKFSHGICPDCYETEVVPQLESLKQQFQN